MRARPFPFLLAAICLLCAAAQIWIFRWGVILPDTVVQYGQVLSGHYEDWHPPVTAWLWRWIGGGRFGSAPFLILVCAMAWAGLWLIARSVARQAGIGWGLAIVAIGLTPILFGELGSILKDSLLAAALLLATGLLVEEERRPAVGVPAAAMLLLAAGTRFNAFFAAAPIAVLLLPERWRHGTVRHLLLTAATGAALFGAASFVNQVVLAPARQEPLLSLVAFDLAGISAESGRSAVPFLNDAAAARIVAACYAPDMFDRAELAACDIGGGLKAWRATSGESAIHVWLGAIAHEPLAYARHRLAHFNRNQRWLERAVPVDAVYLMSAENDLGLAFTPGRAARAVGDAAEWLARSPFGRPATWLAVAIGLLIVAGQLPRPAMVRALALSGLLYGGGYLVVSVAPDLRYNLWTMAAAMIGLVLALAQRPRARLIAVAALPVLLAVAGELLAG